MQNLIIRPFVVILICGGLLQTVTPSITVSNSPPLDSPSQAETVSDRKLVKNPIIIPKKVKKAEPDLTKLKTNFLLPDYTKRLRKDKLIKNTRKMIDKFNKSINPDSMLEHLGEPGTFVWLQGHDPVFIFASDCYSNIIKSNKDEVDHEAYFGKFLKRIRNIFVQRLKRNNHVLESAHHILTKINSLDIWEKDKLDKLAKKSKLKLRILEEDEIPGLKYLKLKKNARILEINMKSPKTTKKNQISVVKANRRKAILNFLNPKKNKKRRRLMLPGTMAAQVDNSHIFVHTFARPPLPQSPLVTNPEDTGTKVIQMRIKVPMKNSKNEPRPYQTE